MFDHEEQEEGAEEHVIALEEVASPDRWRVGGQESGPGLSGVPRRHLPSSLAHVASDSAPIDLQAELEQFTPNALGALPPIRHRQSLDQRDRFLVKPRLTSWPLGFVPPEQPEASAVPFEQDIRFDNQQRLVPMRQAAGSTTSRPRSNGVKVGGFTWRSKTMRCWRRSAFSAMTSGLVFNPY